MSTKNSRTTITTKKKHQWFDEIVPLFLGAEECHFLYLEALNFSNDSNLNNIFHNLIRKKVMIKQEPTKEHVSVPIKQENVSFFVKQEDHHDFCGISAKTEKTMKVENMDNFPVTTTFTHNHRSVFIKKEAQNNNNNESDSFNIDYTNENAFYERICGGETMTTSQHKIVAQRSDGKESFTSADKKYSDLKHYQDWTTLNRVMLAITVECLKGNGYYKSSVEAFDKPMKNDLIAKLREFLRSYFDSNSGFWFGKPSEGDREGLSVETLSYLKQFPSHTISSKGKLLGSRIQNVVTFVLPENIEEILQSDHPIFNCAIKITFEKSNSKAESSSEDEEVKSRVKKAPMGKKGVDLKRLQRSKLQKFKN